MLERNIMRKINNYLNVVEITNSISYLSSKFNIDIMKIINERENITNRSLFNLLKKTLNNNDIDNNKRSDKRAIDIKNIIYYIFNINYNDVNNMRKIYNNNIKYLDIGAGNGDITYNIGKLLKLSKKNVYGLDKKSFSGANICPNYNINMVFYEDINDKNISNTIPFNDNYFDLITMLQVLHHVENINIFMKELNRIMKIGSIIILREHDCNIEGFNHIIDLEHILWSSGETNYDDFASEYYSNYFSVDELKTLFKKFGFEYVKIPYKYSKTSGSTRYYYIAFRKICKNIER